MDERAFLEALFHAAVEAANPARSLAAHLPQMPKGRTIVVGAGKASARMAQAFEQAWTGPVEGLVIVPYHSKLDCKYIDIVEARHPVPDENGVRATADILALVTDLTQDDLVVCLMSGGGSSLMTLPGVGLTLDHKQQVYDALLRCGASIAEMNCVRKHLSAVKGGRLAASCYPAKVATLTISDVPGDDLNIIASGPTVPNDTTPQDALEIIKRYQLDLPAAVMSYLLGPFARTPECADVAYEGTSQAMVCTPQMALEAAAMEAQKWGITPLILGDAIEGEAKDVGMVMAGIAKQVLQHNQPIARPCVLLSGGETTVTLGEKPGRGGRCSEFLLGFWLGISQQEGIYAIACDTDGRDGSEDNAGAILSADVIASIRSNHIDAREKLRAHDAYGFFNEVGGLIHTGPTHTNVNDFRAIYIP